MPRKPVTKLVAKKLADKLGIDLSVVGLDQWQSGIIVELEHGNVKSRTNVTDGNLLMTAKIAAAHLEEYPDYYHRLEKMETTASRYWQKRDKPTIYR